MVTSPRGRAFVDPDALERRTGHPVRSDDKAPGGRATSPPPPDATTARPRVVQLGREMGCGHSDSLPLGLLVEGVGKRLPIVAVPFSTPEQLSFPAVAAAIANLSVWGVTMLEADTDYRKFPWPTAWHALARHPWYR